MKWMISFKLQPGEVVLEEADAGDKKIGLIAMYSPILTDRRALFKFNTLSTSLVQSFPYGEITSVQHATRLVVKYLKLTADGRDYFLNVDDPETWARKIMEHKARYDGGREPAHAPGKTPSLPELLVMLETLKEFGLLSTEEFEEKRRMITR